MTVLREVLPHLAVAGVVAYLLAGVHVARWFAKQEMFILTVRWWHVVFWPILPIGWVLTCIAFWIVS